MECHPNHVALRGSFLIDRQGIARHQVVKICHSDEMLRMVDALRFFEEQGKLCPAGWKNGEFGMEASPEGVAEYLSHYADKL